MKALGEMLLGKDATNAFLGIFSEDSVFNDWDLLLESDIDEEQNRQSNEAPAHLYRPIR